MDIKSVINNTNIINYRNRKSIIINDDCIKALKNISDKTIDLIFADPPYFLSNGGITCTSGKISSVDKAEWDKSKSFIDKYTFTKNWISECRRILKDTGSIFISGTMHNIYLVGVVLEEENFKILNNITWEKTSPPPNLSCRYFTHSTETILWARKNDKISKHKFNYHLMKEMNNNKQMKDVWKMSSVSKNEKRYGKHPTQKPEKLLERIVLSASDSGDIVLDPFLGSGTTGVVAVRLGRLFIGIEKEKEYISLSIKRIEDELA